MTPERAAIVAEGQALAAARFERGQSLTAAERETFALVADDAVWSVAIGQYIKRLGRGYVVDHPSMRAAGIFARKLDAVRAWAVMIELWRALVALEASGAVAAQPALPGDVGAVRGVEVPAPALAEEPFSLRADVWAPKVVQGSLF